MCMRFGNSRRYFGLKRVGQAETGGDNLPKPASSRPFEAFRDRVFEG